MSLVIPPIVSGAGDITTEEAAVIISQVKSIIPEGWSITRTQHHCAPDDWATFDEVGFLVEGHKTETVFRIWFLPRDWIGIRKHDPQPVPHNFPPVQGAPGSGVYWDGILVGDKYKTITICPDETIHETMRKLDMHTPSLVNGGWGEAQKLFKDRFDQANRKAEQLIEQFCKDQASRDQATLSLIVLGVPAKNVIRRCALEGKGRPRESCVSALGYFGGKDSVATLCQVLEDSQSSEICQRYAAWCLTRIADPAAAPVLVKAFDRAANWETADHIAKALERVRYASAAPKILERMERQPCAEFAKVLASLRYNKAIPAIEKICKVKQFTAEWALTTWQSNYLGSVPEIALLRLTGQWGQPADGVRLLLLPPEKLMTGKRWQVALLVENAGDMDLMIPEYLCGQLVVNGTAHKVGPSGWNGMANLNVNDVWVYPYDLSELLQQPGRNEIRYEVGHARSNTLVLDVPALVVPAGASGQQTAEDFFNRGKVKMTTNDPDGAIDEFSKAIELNPKYAEAYKNRAIAKQTGVAVIRRGGSEIQFSYRGDRDDILPDLSKVIELNPKSEEAYTARAGYKSYTKDLEGAIADFSKAIELNPKSDFAYHYRGGSKLRNGNFDGAIADYTKVIELNPKHNEAYRLRGVAKQLKGDLDGAITDYTRQIEIYPEDGFAYSKRGVAKQLKGDLDGAITDFNRAIELKPLTPYAYSNRGAAKQMKGDVDGAIADCSKAIELNSEDAAAYRNRGIAKKAKGDLAGSAEDLAQASRLPQPPIGFP